MSMLPEVAKPKQQLSFKDKLLWTGIILTAFFVLGMVPLFGLGQNALQQFEYLSIVLGASFGSLISLGIGPIVTASIVLQLLNGSGIVHFDLTSHEGKANYQSVQKALAIFFIIFEAAIYVFMGGLAPAATLTGALKLQMQLMLIIQLMLGGFLIMMMDEVISKWGFGSGISLFIAAGVSKEIFIKAFSFLPSPTNPNVPIGAIPTIFTALSAQDTLTVGLMIGSILATIIVFLVAVYAQSMKVEIPLSFGKIRGHTVRWPLRFMYTSNIPVILVAALLANFQLWARLLQNWGHPILGTFSGNSPATGFITWIYAPDLLQAVIKGTISWSVVSHSLVYMLFMIGGAVLFSVFWVQTSGMDAKAVAKQIMGTGLQIPGFRKDQRILEKILSRYIGPLTIMGAITVGFLAALADLSGALSRGTGILLTVMIIYQLYENIAKQNMMDMNPMFRKFMGK